MTWGLVQRRATLRFARLQISFQVRLALYREIIALMRAGLSKNEALNTIWKVASNEGRRPREPKAVMIADVLTGLKNGLGLGHALGKWVPSEDAMVVEAIESSDRFPEYLEKFCGALKRRAGIRAAIAGGLAYPVFLLVLVAGLLVYVGSVVIPALDNLLPVETWTGNARGLALASSFAARYAYQFAIAHFLASILILVALRRWGGFGRKYADALPVFAIYRIYTGVSFLIAMSSLMASGLTAATAIEKLRPFSSPYLRHRLDLIRFYLLNGSDLGSAMYFAGTSWPDRKLNLSLKVLAQTSNLSTQILAVADEWLATSQERVERSLGTLRALAFIAVFGAIAFVVSAMYQIQHQIAAGI
ncbi:MAG: type II secretion system F family protein [Albidovulum sp.]|nr:type II secretion system F family protein [Albidovulum sp.]MDE0303324.1 type II secretion system F family protein [Albidovulum sp.]MDE0534200.1 type II secretion system F family protein [Albidovulum sp.]